MLENIKKATFLDHFGIAYYCCLHNHPQGKRKMKKEARKDFRRKMKKDLDKSFQDWYNEYIK